MKKGRSIELAERFKKNDSKRFERRDDAETD